MDCLIFHDSFGYGASYIKSHLARSFPKITKPWIVKPMPGNLFLVEPPDLAWRRMVMEMGELWLGDVSYPIETYDPYKHDGGVDPIPIWIQIDGIPPRLRTDYEFKRIADELGGIIIDVDPRAKDELTTVRMCLGMPNKKLVSSSRELSFLDEFGRSRFYPIIIAVESLPVPSGEAAKGKLYWQEVHKFKENVSGPGSSSLGGGISSTPNQGILTPMGKGNLMENSQSSNQFACLVTEEDQDKSEGGQVKEWDKWSDKGKSSGKVSEGSLDLVVQDEVVPTMPSAETGTVATQPVVPQVVQVTHPVVVPEPTRHSTRQRGGQVIQVFNCRGRGGRGGL